MQETWAVVLADSEPNTPVGGGNGACAGSLMDKNFIFLMLAMFAIMYFVMIRPQKKRQKEQKKMLEEVGKGTKIRTIGGIIGTIVQEQGDEIVIKIDETTNTKMRIVRSAIGKVLTEEEEKKSD